MSIIDSDLAGIGYEQEIGDVLRMIAKWTLLEDKIVAGVRNGGETD